MTKDNKTTMKGLATIFVVAILFFAYYVSADPSGASFTFVRNSTNNGTVAGSDNEEGGTINEVLLNAIQQNGNWKAYVGNVSGDLTLDDANNYTIYDWDVSIQGEVFASRNGSLSFTTIGCAATAAITAENDYFVFDITSTDTINATYNGTNHSAFTVGSTTFAEAACSNVNYPYLNDTPQAEAASAPWQTVLLNDSDSNIIYTAIISDDADGYTNLSIDTYDFQLIIPENGTNPTPTTYYFYVELG